MTFLTRSHWVPCLNHINPQSSVTPIFQSITLSPSRGQHSLKGFSIIAFRISFETIPTSPGGDVTCWRCLDLITCQWNVFRPPPGTHIPPCNVQLYHQQNNQAHVFLQRQRHANCKDLKCKRKSHLAVDGKTKSLGLLQGDTRYLRSRENHKDRRRRGTESQPCFVTCTAVHKLYGFTRSVGCDYRQNPSPFLASQCECERNRIANYLSYSVSLQHL